MDKVKPFILAAELSKAKEEKEKGGEGASALLPITDGKYMEAKGFSFTRSGSGEMSSCNIDGTGQKGLIM